MAGQTSTSLLRAALPFRHDLQRGVVVSVFASIAMGTGWSRALAITRTFAGWQLLTGFWTYGITAGIGYAIRITKSLREKEAARGSR